MDQALLAGVGNVLKSEILWYAGISPMRKIETLAQKEVEALYEGIRVVSRIFYNRDGFRHVDETPSFAKYNPQQLQIYGKESAKQTVTTDGRLTYWDPYKQY
jgi:formamidopyrimidine-DNA glycosylase